MLEQETERQAETAAEELRAADAESPLAYHQAYERVLARSGRTVAVAAVRLFLTRQDKEAQRQASAFLADLRQEAQAERTRKAAAPAPRLAQVEGWPPGVIARYLTVAGALVDVRETGPRDDEGDVAATFAECHGCPQHEGREWNTHPRGAWLTVSEAAAEAEYAARAWAQAHAEICRAMPLPTKESR
ncbi:hypothetical protein [Streptomyces sp. NPDC007063]|uniref:hypothetical protein n=1 Tax=Streptomyces sp. NPDC007063 TaxID=3364772 RepID=UPI0036BC0FAE